LLFIPVRVEVEVVIEEKTDLLSSNQFLHIVPTSTSADSGWERKIGADSVNSAFGSNGEIEGELGEKGL